MIQIRGVAGVLLALLLVVQFVLIAWKTIAILRLQRDVAAMDRFLRTWGQRMLTKTSIDQGDVK